MSKKKRATCIVEMPNASGEICVLMSKQLGDQYDMLPGGRVEEDEPPIVSAIRELLEETTLESEIVVKLSEYESEYTMHYVFYVRTTDYKFEPKDDVETLWLLPLSECHQIDQISNISSSTKYIIGEYLKWRTGKSSVVNLL